MSDDSERVTVLIKLLILNRADRNPTLDPQIGKERKATSRKLAKAEAL